MATQTSFTVLEALTRISDLRGESPVDTNASRIRAVSHSERDFAKRKFWRTHLLRDQTTTSTGSADVTIGSSTFPMRMKGLTELFVDGTLESSRYEIVDFNVFKIRYNNSNSDRMVYEWYDATNDLWKVHINPTPETGKIITYSYYWEPPTRTATTDVIVCPNVDIIARLTLASIYEGEDEDKYQEQLMLAESLIDEYVALENSPAVNQLYTVSAIENASRPRGIGTY